MYGVDGIQHPIWQWNAVLMTMRVVCVKVAAAGGHGELVSLLLARGADPNLQRSNGSTALALAMKVSYNEA